jgi:hypothetical protein
MAMSCNTSSTMVAPTISTFSPGDFLSVARGGKTCVRVSSEVMLSCTWLSGNSTLCENSRRMPPS